LENEATGATVFVSAHGAGTSLLPGYTSAGGPDLVRKERLAVFENWIEVPAAGGFKKGRKEDDGVLSQHLLTLPPERTRF